MLSRRFFDESGRAGYYDVMTTKIHIAAAQSLLRPWSKTLRSVAQRTIPQVGNRIDIDGIEILICADPQQTIPATGIGGCTPNGQTVFIWVDPGHPHFRQSINQQLKRTLAHELHHAARWRTVGYGRHLFEALVTEGLADHFELEIFGGKPEPHDQVVRGSALKKIEAQAVKEYWSPKYDHTAWFFGSVEKHLPFWGGYTLGFNLVQRYLKTHPGTRPSTLVDVPGQDLFVKTES